METLEELKNKYKKLQELKRYKLIIALLENILTIKITHLI